MKTRKLSHAIKLAFCPNNRMLHREYTFLSQNISAYGREQQVNVHIVNKQGK